MAVTINATLFFCLIFIVFCRFADVSRIPSASDVDQRNFSVLRLQNKTKNREETKRNQIKWEERGVPIWPSRTTDANSFVDDLLAKAEPKIQEKLEPLSLPEATWGFWKKVLLVNVSGEAKIFDGWLAGLSTLHRTGDAVLYKSIFTDSLSITAHLGLSNLLGHYKGHIKFMNIGPSVDIHVKLRFFGVKVVVWQSIDPPQPPRLNIFEIENLHDISVEVDGLGPLDWILNSFVNFVSNTFKSVIIWVVEERLRRLIDSVLPEIKLSF